MIGAIAAEFEKWGCEVTTPASQSYPADKQRFSFRFGNIQYLVAIINGKLCLGATRRVVKVQTDKGLRFYIQTASPEKKSFELANPLVFEMIHDWLLNSVEIKYDTYIEEKEDSPSNCFSPALYDNSSPGYTQ